MKKLFLIILILTTSILYSQNKDITGIYGEGLIGKLNTSGNYIELKSDSTFTYNFFGKKYYGNWMVSDKKLLLNPKVKKEFAKIQWKESKINSDSITIKINYIFKTDNSDHSKNQDFRMATVYFNKKENYVNILKNPLVRMGGWAPRIQKQKILDHNNSVKLSQKDFSQIGFMTFHLEDYIIFIKKDKDSNFFEFDIEDIWEDENIIQDSFIIDGKILLPTNSKNKLDLLGKPLIKKKI